MCENKGANQLRGDRLIDCTIPLFLNPKLQAPNHLLWLYIPVCVGLGQKPQRQVSLRHSSDIHANTPYNIGM